MSAERPSEDADTFAARISALGMPLGEVEHRDRDLKIEEAP